MKRRRRKNKQLIRELKKCRRTLFQIELTMLFQNTSPTNAAPRISFPFASLGREGSPPTAGAVAPSDTLPQNLKLKTAPVFYLSHVFAIFPFVRDRQLQIRYVSLAFSAALLLAAAVLAFLHVQNIRRTEQSNTNVLLYTGYAFIDCVLVVACIVTPIVNRSSIVSILKGFSKVDTIIAHLQPGFKFGENLKRQNVQVAFTIGATMWFVVAYFKACQENVFPGFTYLEFYLLPVVWLIIFQIDYLLVHLRERFAFVNSQLESLLRERDSEISTLDGADMAKVDTFYLNKLNYIHFTLYEISGEINGTFSAQLLVAIPRVIFFCVLPVHYNIVTALVKDPNDPGLPTLWTHLFTLSYIVLLTSPVIYAVNVASSTVTQLLVFSIQLLHRKVDFSVKQFFSLKPSLTMGMFELIITYVIILLQFQDTLASISPIRLLLRPIMQSTIISNVFGDRSSELLSNETDSMDYEFNDTAS